MRCPFCSHEDTAVKDSRPGEDSQTIKRRRYCSDCGMRFSTIERVQFREIQVVKRSGKREPFDREKLSRAVFTAVRKRNISNIRVEQLLSAIVRKIEMTGEAEIPANTIGEYALEGLLALDRVAYIRFASVYCNFQNLQDFNEFISNLRAIK
jgi:transcriptional repressor NrdR